MDEIQRANALKRFKEWQRYAQDDEQLIEIALKEKAPANPICFHAQQIAEKYLKGFLAYHKRPILKLHSLSELLRLCIEIDPAFEELTESVICLSAYYIETRYPGDYPEFTLDEARNSYKAALRVKELVLERVSAS